jgi:hypothetical protein
MTNQSYSTVEARVKADTGLDHTAPPDQLRRLAANSSNSLKVHWLQQSGIQRGDDGMPVDRDGNKLDQGQMRQVQDLFDHADAVARHMADSGVPVTPAVLHGELKFRDRYEQIQGDVKSAKTTAGKQVAEQQLDKLMGQRSKMMEDAQRSHDAADMRNMAAAAKARGDDDTHAAYMTAAEKTEAPISKQPELAKEASAEEPSAKPVNSSTAPAAEAAVPAAESPAPFKPAAASVVSSAQSDSAPEQKPTREPLVKVEPVYKEEAAAAAAPQPSPKAAAIDAAAHQAATSPHNDLPQPTDAQKEAGNYQLGHVRLQGLNLSIENPRGSTRSGTDSDGKQWSVQLKDHYGYLRGTVGADADHVDAFVGDHPDSKTVYVIDQVDPKTLRFDEHKVMVGYPSEAAAREAYQRNYAPGWKGLGAITAVPVDELKQKLDASPNKPIGKLKLPMKR